MTAINENVPSPVGSPDLPPSLSLNGTNSHVEGEDVDKNENASNLRTGRSMLDAEPGATRLWGQLRKSLWAIERTGTLRERGTCSQTSSGKERVAQNGIVTSVGLKSRGTAGEDLGSDGPVDILKEAFHTNGHAKEVTSTIPSPDPSTGYVGRGSGEGSGDDTEEEFQDASESADVLQDGDNMVRSASSPAISDTSPPKKSKIDCPWDEELRSLVRGGVPMALRGEV